MGSFFLYASLSAVLLSYVSSLRAFRLDTPQPFRHFSFFLLFVLIGEVFGVLWPRYIYQFTPFSRNNQWFYNFFHLLSCLFYLYFFYRVLTLPVIKKAIVLLAIVYTLFAVINLLFFQGVMQLNTYTELFICFIMVFLSISYYFQLLYSSQIVHLNCDTLFWISTGILIYNLGSMMGIFLINVMNAISNEKARSIHYIIQLSAVLMYVNFTIAFLCRKIK